MYGVQAVDMIVCTKEDKLKIVPMHLEVKGKEWVCNVEEGKVVYKYRINGGIIELNDPCADYYTVGRNSQVWSVKESGALKEISIKLLNSIITDRVMNDINKVVSRKNLNMQDSRDVVIGIKLTDVLGVHVLTAIWYQPDGRIYHIDERTLMSENNVEAEVWFWLKLCEMQPRFCKGAWTLEIYIDGCKRVRDNFVINEKIQEQYIGFTCTA